MLKLLVVVLGLAPAAVLAGGFPVLGSGRTSCESLWVERNQIMNVAGYCFNSALGQAVFDNSDCVPGPAALSESALNRIAQLQNAEARLTCEIDAGFGSLVVDGRYGPLRFGSAGLSLGRWPTALENLDVFPELSSRERSCTVSGLSNTGDGFLALRSGPDVRYPQLGQMFNGDRVSSNYSCIGRWCFADSVLIGNQSEALNGWFNVRWCQP